MYPLDDTIAAIASPPAGAVRGIIRLSGPAIINSLRPWFDSVETAQTALRAEVIRGRFVINERTWLPGDLYLWPNSQSYTRQPTAELHTLGSPPLLARLLENLCATGARLAQPGEFTLRAFLAGRLDLTQAEAVLGVIDAESEQQLHVALEQLAGGISYRLRELRGALLDLLADLEAGLDFVEEDIEFVTVAQATARLREARDTIVDLQNAMHSRETHRLLPRVALVGLPNVGKSRLMNALARQHVAIVSDRAGTTRDTVTVTLHWNGITCELVDTAGRDTIQGMTVDAIAQRHSRFAADHAAVRLICLDGSRSLTSQEETLVSMRDVRVDILVATKSDLPPRLPYAVDVKTSAETGQGLGELTQRIEQLLLRDQQLAGEAVGTTVTRCRDSLRSCAERLNAAAVLAESQRGDELVCAEIRVALDELGSVVGAIYTDDILDRIFSRFCIGK